MATVRYGSAASAAANNFILAKGELGYTYDDDVLKVGDGVNHWNDLDAIAGGGGGGGLTTEQVQDLVGAMIVQGTGTTVTYDDGAGTVTVAASVLTTEQVQDIVGAMVTGNTETGITVTYDDADGTLDFVAAVTTAYTDEQAQDAVAAILAAGTHTGITVTYNDAGGTLSLATTITQYTDEMAQDAVGGMWTGNTETRIAVTYDDAGAKLNAVVEPFPVAIPFYLSGAITTGVGTKRFYNPMGRTVTVKKITVHVVTAPTGAALVVDANINGTTMYTTQGNRPSIAAAANVSTSGSTDSGASGWDDGEYITVDIDQVGSTVAGSDLTGMIYGEI